MPYSSTRLDVEKTGIRYKYGNFNTTLGQNNV